MLNWPIRVFLFLGAASYPLERLGSFGSDVFILSAAKLLTMILALLAFVHWLTSGRSPTGRGSPKLPWLAAFAASLVISVLYSVYRGVPTDVLIRYSINSASVLLLYLILTQLLTNRRNLDVLLAGWVMGGALSSVSSLVLEPDTVWTPERRAGVGAGANEHAGNMLLALAFAYALFSAGIRGWKRALLPLLAGMNGMGFLLAASRSAFLGAVAMAGLWAVRFRRIQDARALVVLMLIAIFAVVFAPDSYTERLSTLSRVADRATRTADVEERLRREGGAVVAFVTNPVLGIGATGFPSWAQENGFPVNTVHNAVLRVAAEQGLIGLVPYLGILVLTWLHLSRAFHVARRHRGAPEMQALAMRAVMVQIGFAGLLTVAMFQPGTLWKGMWITTGASTVVWALVQIRARELGGQPTPAEATPALPPFAERV